MKDVIFEGDILRARDKMRAVLTIYKNRIMLV